MAELVEYFDHLYMYILELKDCELVIDCILLTVNVLNLFYQSATGDSLTDLFSHRCNQLEMIRT